jgi:hypothetical protein
MSQVAAINAALPPGGGHSLDEFMAEIQKANVDEKVGHNPRFSRRVVPPLSMSVKTMMRHHKSTLPEATTTESTQSAARSESERNGCTAI